MMISNNSGKSTIIELGMAGKYPHAAVQTGPPVGNGMNEQQDCAVQ
jgi:hypothetical protein